MALQDPERLWAFGLGVEGDVPANDLQEQLADGIHIRWAFPPQVGFPWHGYYLFRRDAGRKRKPQCISKFMGIAPNPAGASLPTPLGTVTSDAPLAFTNLFPEPHRFEFDLRNRSFLSLGLPSGLLAHQAMVRIGFLRGEQRCTGFQDFDAGAHPNPLKVNGASFTVFASGDVPEPSTQILPSVSPEGTQLGLDAGTTLLIDLPCASVSVVIKTVNNASPGKIVAANAAGDSVHQDVLPTGFATTTITAPGISQVRILTPNNETVVLQVCYDCETDKDRCAEKPETIRITGLLGGTPVVEQTAKGSAGQVVDTYLTADGIDEVRVSGGKAALIDICLSDAGDALRGGGWQKLADFKYPLCLPVAQPDYPCAGAPATEPAAEAEALSRVLYGSPAPWQGQSFDDLHQRLEHIVAGGPAAGAMADKSTTEAGVPGPPPGLTGSFVHQSQKPLDLVLMGSIHPPIAQMVGIYWVDQTAAPGKPYDYLLLADHDDEFGGDPDVALQSLPGLDFSDVDGFILFNQVRAPADPLAGPEGLMTYALPGATRRSSAGDLIDATNNAGLRWKQVEPQGLASAVEPVLYHLWRSGPTETEPSPLPGADTHTPVTKNAPLIASSLASIEQGLTAAGTAQQRSGEWPPFPMHYVDSALAEGWYSYQVSAVDLFGRHSGNSDPGAWRQWSPEPQPEPWYFQQPPGNQTVHPALIRLLDKQPPPAPAAVEGWLLDPDDPSVFNDATYQAWRDGQAGEAPPVGLRVSWVWTARQTAQAPDTEEFRIYWRPERINALAGRITGVTAIGGNACVVTTDIAHAAPGNALADLWLSSDGTQFKIQSSSAASPLQLTLGNAGPAKEIQPGVLSAGSVLIPPSHPLAVDYSDAVAWNERIAVVAFDEAVTLVGNERRYEILLPLNADGVQRSYDLQPHAADPIRYGAIGVSAADGRVHSADPRGEGRFGNEGPVAGPAPVVQVLRQPPDAPPPPADGEETYASPADYHAASYYTFAWTPAPHLLTHIYRALDDALYKTDQSQRPKTPVSENSDIFPTADPRFDQAKRAQVADELNTLNAFDPDGQSEEMQAAYRELSNDAKRILAGLPENAPAFTQITISPLHPDAPDAEAPDGLKWRRIGPDVAPGSLAQAARAYVDKLDGKSRNRYFYRAAYADQAGNTGPLGLSSAPVRLPEVNPLPAPRISKVVGGDREMVLRWKAHPLSTAIRVYHTTDRAAVEDLRLFTEPPVEMPGDASQFVHADRPGQVVTYYRVVSVSTAQLPTGPVEIVSAPSAVASAAAFDLTPPTEPVWVAHDRIGLDGTGTEVPFDATDPTLIPAVRLEWSTPDPAHEAMVQRRVPGALVWQTVMSWTENATVFIDAKAEATVGQRYRVTHRRTNGQSRTGPVIEVAAV